MCDLCKLDANYFHSSYCVYEHLVEVHPVLWLRDSSLNKSGYISRSLLSPNGEVLAIWNGVNKGWRLRKLKREALDEQPDPNREDFADLSSSDDKFCHFMRINC